MNKSIVISQPYYFPWIGQFEQLKQADIYIHYDDVQFSKGHFQDRVQIKTSYGFKWLTVPKKNLKLENRIFEVLIDNSKNWKRSQLDFLAQVYKEAPFYKEMYFLVKSVFENEFRYLSELTISSIMSAADYYELIGIKQFCNSSEVPISGKSTQRVLEFIKYFKANRYITGMGALKYFDFELFEKERIKVEFLNYQKKPYPQLYGKFNPFVSILDLIANTGKEGINYICSSPLYWREFIKTDNAKKYLIIQ